MTTLKAKWSIAGQTKEIEINTPEINGSEKQIDWALKIQGNILAAICSSILPKLGDKYATDADTITPLVHKLFKRSDAKFWIENRTKPVAELLKNEK